MCGFAELQLSFQLLLSSGKGNQHSPAHVSVVMWVPRGSLPKMAGYVQVGSPKYDEWQVIAYAVVRDETLFQWKCELYEKWLAAQPSMVDRRSYTMPTCILQRSEESSRESDEDVDDDDEWEIQKSARATSAQDDLPEAESPSDRALSVTVLDYEDSNVKNSALTYEQQQRLVEMLKSDESIMILSGNALPPPAYGIVYDIDVNNHDPIKQRARRIPLRYLQKLYELLKGLLKAELIAFSDSPWASPIVIVLKKNGQDIQLCIDYKMVNTVTAIMEYAMPLVNDLLTELESNLWP
ncbi:hypothetical protein PHMEG_00019841 [Phytophthora megakarya]|uniref:Reverse transcriptase n=1 Tax=Phytophthora megakarya TaxID=4795 RepID=A0A225VRH5_9STRA|nr:hypothetical protein PHMEG_00019841 [Phytophthora megakarya]